MFDRRRRLRAAVLVLPLWVSLLAYSTLGAPLASAGTVTTPTSCTNNAQAGTSALPITLAGDASGGTTPGGTITLSGATFKIDVPGTVLLAGYSLGLLTAGVNSIPADVNLTLLSTNTSAASTTIPPLSVNGVTTISDPTPANKTSGDETATPLAVTANIPTTTWTASGGDVAISLGGSSTTALVGPGGLIAVTFSCVPGTPGPAGCGPAPLTACSTTEAAPALPFTTVTAVGTTTSTTVGGSTTTTTAGGGTTTTTAVGGSTTTTTAGGVTTSTTSGSATPSAVSGTATYTTTCSNSVTPDKSELLFKVTGTTTSPVAAGSTASLTNQSWEVTVPGSVLQTGIGLGLLKVGDSPAGTAKVAVFASNTKEGTVSPAPIPVVVAPITLDGGGQANPAVAKFAAPDMSWTAVGGGISYAMESASVEVSIGPLKVTFTCHPKDAGLSIVTTSVSGTTGTPAAGRTQVLGATVSQLPRTGGSVALPLALGLALVDLGYLCASAARPARRRLRHLIQG